MKTLRRPMRLAPLAIACALATLLTGCAGIASPGSVKGVCDALGESMRDQPPGPKSDELFEQGIAIGCWKRQ